MKKMKWIFLLGLAARVLFFIWFTVQGHYYPDEGIFYTLAHEILDGNGMIPTHTGWGGYVQAGEPTAYFGFTAPVFFAVLAFIFDNEWLWLRLFTALLSWSVLFFAVKEYCRLRWSDTVTFVVLLLASIHPFLVPFAGFIIAEAVFIPLFALCLYWGERFRWHPSLFNAVILGVLYGICDLTKMNFFGFQWLHMAYLIWSTKRSFWKNYAAFFLGTALVLTPWLMRNHHVFGHWILETKGGFNLVLMNLPRPGFTILTQNFSTEPDLSLWPELEPLKQGWVGKNEGDRSLFALKIYGEMLKNHPFELLQNAVARFLNTFPLSPVYWNVPPAIKTLSIAVSVVFYFLILMGVRFCLTHRKGGELVLLLGYTIVFNSLTNGSIRHRVGAEVFLLLLALLGILHQKWKLNTNEPILK